MPTLSLKAWCDSMTQASLPHDIVQMLMKDATAQVQKLIELWSLHTQVERAFAASISPNTLCGKIDPDNHSAVYASMFHMALGSACQMSTPLREHIRESCADLHRRSEERSRFLRTLDHPAAKKAVTIVQTGETTTVAGWEYQLREENVTLKNLRDIIADPMATEAVIQNCHMILEHLQSVRGFFYVCLKKCSGPLLDDVVTVCSKQRAKTKTASREEAGRWLSARKARKPANIERAKIAVSSFFASKPLADNYLREMDSMMKVGTTTKEIWAFMKVLFDTPAPLKYTLPSAPMEYQPGATIVSEY